MNIFKLLFRRRRDFGPATVGNGSYTLVIVDMQPRFHTSQKRATLYAVEREIQRAKELNNPIVVLEYDDYGLTDTRLTDAIGSYRLCRTCVKTDDDGSKEVLEACDNEGYTTERFRVCGVNTHACVQSTVSGLAKKVRDCIVEVVKAACNDSPENDWAGFKLRKNVVLA